jgi:hypothetical protein
VPAGANPLGDCDGPPALLLFQQADNTGTHGNRMQKKFVELIGWSASSAAVIMFIAYVDQIRLNLGGHKGSVIQPAATIFNCALWIAYGASKEKKDWPIIIANIPGVILGAIASLTAM